VLLRIYDPFGVPLADLPRGRAEVTSTLKDAGVSVEWRNGPDAVASGIIAADRSCGMKIVVRISRTPEHVLDLFEKAGRRMPVEDSYIAATARRYGLTIVTGNDRDFRRPGLRVFNPFNELPNM
jgi:predicted nucleic acid-binding protein